MLDLKFVTVSAKLTSSHFATHPPPCLAARDAEDAAAPGAGVAPVPAAARATAAPNRAPIRALVLAPRLDPSLAPSPAHLAEASPDPRPGRAPDLDPNRGRNQNPNPTRGVARRHRKGSPNPDRVLRAC